MKFYLIGLINQTQSFYQIIYLFWLVTIIVFTNDFEIFLNKSPKNFMGSKTNVSVDFYFFNWPPRVAKF